MNKTKKINPAPLLCICGRGEVRREDQKRKNDFLPEPGEMSC